MSNSKTKPTMTSQDAVDAVFVKFETQYQHRVWSDSDIDVMNEKLSPFDPGVILAAANQMLEEEEFYSIAALVRICEEATGRLDHAGRWAKRLEKDTVPALPRRRLLPTVPLRVYGALWRAGQHLTDEQLRIIAKHREEFFHLCHDEVLPRVMAILDEEWDPYA